MSKPRFGTKQWHARKEELEIKGLEVFQELTALEAYVDLSKMPVGAPPFTANGLTLTAPGSIEDSGITLIAPTEPFYQEGLDSIVVYLQMPNPNNYLWDNMGTLEGQLYSNGGIMTYAGFTDMFINQNELAEYNVFVPSLIADVDGYTLDGVGNSWNAEAPYWSPNNEFIPWSEGSYIVMVLTNINYVAKTYDWAIHSTASVDPTVAVASGTLSLEYSIPFDALHWYGSVNESKDVAIDNLVISYSLNPSTVIPGLPPTQPAVTVDRSLVVEETDRLHICKIEGINQPVEFEDIGVLKPGDHVFVDDNDNLAGVFMTPSEIESIVAGATPTRIAPINFVDMLSSYGDNGQFTETTVSVNAGYTSGWGAYTGGVALDATPKAIHFKAKWSAATEDSWQLMVGFCNEAFNTYILADFKDLAAGETGNCRIDLGVGSQTTTIQAQAEAKPLDTDEFAIVCTDKSIELYKNGTSIGSFSQPTAPVGIDRAFAVINDIHGRPGFWAIRNPVYPIAGTLNLFAGT